MISIINYGLGNLASVANMIRKAGGTAVVVNQPGDLVQAKKIILPGVGAFDRGMQLLREGGWIEVLNQKVMEEKVPVLGICLGMQLMCQSSEEGTLPGLGWINATVLRFQTSESQPIRIPHMGWNYVHPQKSHDLFHLSEDAVYRYYFVHSYFVQCANANDVLATCNYGSSFTAAFSCNNLHGVQFHPEKSHRYGLELMKRFNQMPC